MVVLSQLERWLCNDLSANFIFSWLRVRHAYVLIIVSLLRMFLRIMRQGDLLLIVSLAHVPAHSETG